jgi:hypothetical protein
MVPEHVEAVWAAMEGMQGSKCTQRLKHISNFPMYSKI